MGSKLAHEMLTSQFENQYLPPPSTPRATGHSPAHTKAADPLDEPPEIRLGSYGFRDDLHY